MDGSRLPRIPSILTAITGAVAVCILAGAGKVALWTKADSVTRFDSIEIRTLP